MRSSGAYASSCLTMNPGSVRASRVEYDSSRNRRPSSMPHRSILTVPGSMPMTRGTWLPGRRDRGRCRRGRQQLTGDVPDRLGVEHGVVSLEQLGDAALVHFHLEG